MWPNLGPKRLEKGEEEPWQQTLPQQGKEGKVADEADAEP